MRAGALPDGLATAPVAYEFGVRRQSEAATALWIARLRNTSVINNKSAVAAISPIKPKH